MNTWYWVLQKSIKERATVEHLAEHLIKEEYEFKDCFPDEEIAVTKENGSMNTWYWVLYVNSD